MDAYLRKLENLILFCCAPVSNPNNAFWPTGTPASNPAPPLQGQIEEALEKKKEVARRLARAIMNGTNPQKQAFSKKERKRIRRTLEKIIIEELGVMEQEKNEGKPVSYIG